MDPRHDILLWYHTYRDTLTRRAGEAPVAVRTTDHGRPLRRSLARWCGHAALRVGTWLLAEEARTDVELADGSQYHTLASRP